MKTITVNSPFDLIRWGIYNYYANLNGVEKVELQYSSDLEGLVEKSKLSGWLGLLYDKGAIPDSFMSGNVSYPSSFVRDLDAINDLAFSLESHETIFYLSTDTLSTDKSWSIWSKTITYDLAFIALNTALEIRSSLLQMDTYGVSLKGDFVGYYIQQSPYTHYLTQLGYLKFNYEISSEELDVVNTSIFILISQMQGYYSDKLYTFTEKRAKLKELGLVKGSVVFLYKRSKFRNLTDKSIVESCRLAKIKSIDERKVVFVTYQIKKTYEQLWLEFSRMPENVQDMYHQFSEYAPYAQEGSTFEVPFDSLGVSYMMNDDSHFSESYFVTSLESLYPAELTILNEHGEFDTLKCTTVQAVYYLLKFYGVRFSENLFRKQYGTAGLDQVKKLVSKSSRHLMSLLGYNFKEV